MIAATVDRGLQAFEERVANPRTVKQAARLLKKLVGRGMDADLVREIQRLRSGNRDRCGSGRSDQSPENRGSTDADVATLGQKSSREDTGDGRSEREGRFPTDY